MNTHRRISLYLLGAFALLQLSSCTKLFDKVFGEDSSSKKCRITSFRQDDTPFGGPKTSKFYYNKHGDIDSIIGDVETGSLGPFRYYFTYDKKQRLVKFREDLGPSYPYYIDHLYAYENGRVVRDSITAITYSGIPDEGSSTTIQSLEYDSYGRIVRQTSKILNNADGTIIAFGDPIDFIYNDQGNLVFESATYDNKVNFLGTSEQLMFISRNYSRNNLTGAIGYNDRNLPLGFVSGTRFYIGGSGLFDHGLPSLINYSCK